MALIAALVALAGFALIVTGSTVLFGPWSLIVSGAALIVAALVPDWERGA
jgi:hypothetical protein